MNLPADELWRLDAACLGTDPEVFFPDNPSGVNFAKKICDTCPVISDCLEWAIANEEWQGVWGGTSIRERKRIVKIRRAVAATSA